MRIVRSRRFRILRRTPTTHQQPIIRSLSRRTVLLSPRERKEVRGYGTLGISPPSNSSAPLYLRLLTSSPTFGFASLGAGRGGFWAGIAWFWSFMAGFNAGIKRFQMAMKRFLKIFLAPFRALPVKNPCSLKMKLVVQVSGGKTQEPLERSTPQPVGSLRLRVYGSDVGHFTAEFGSGGRDSWIGAKPRCVAFLPLGGSPAQFQSSSSPFQGARSDFSPGTPGVWVDPPEFRLSSPRFCRFSPEFCRPTPRKCGGTPENYRGTPKKCGISPKKYRRTPEKYGATPKKCGKTPEKCGTSPEKYAGTPEKCGRTPRKCRRTPEKQGGTLGKCGGTPEMCGSSRRK